MDIEVAGSGTGQPMVEATAVRLEGMPESPNSCTPGQSEVAKRGSPTEDSSTQGLQGRGAGGLRS